MKELNLNEMKEIQGGGVNWTVLAGIGAFISLIAGIVDGYINPKKCNN